MTSSDIELTDIFSRLLLNFKKYDALRSGTSRDTPSKTGHGPFCSFESGSTAFDLRLNQNRWVYGHSHPLLIKSTVDSLLHSLPNSQILQSKIQDLNTNITLEKKYIFTSIIPALYDAIEQIKTNKIFSSYPIFYLTELKVLNQKDFQKIIEKINSTNGKCILVENNLFNYNSEGSICLPKLEVKPEVFITNWGLPNYSIYTDIELESMGTNGLNSSDQLITQNFLHYIRESLITGTDGLMAQREKSLKEYSKTLATSSIIMGNCLIIPLAKNSQELILEKGILHDVFNGDSVFNFPIMLKKQHLDSIFIILRELT